MFEAADLIVVGLEIVPRSAESEMKSQLTCTTREGLRFGFGEPRAEQCDVQLEERVGDLQHQDVRVIMLVADKDSLAGPPHAMFDIVFFQSFQASKH